MLSFKAEELSTHKMHGYMLGAVAPRPIAFASTIDKKGNINLSPYSFFNAFSANPPILVFSPARRVRDNTTKHTLENIREVPEVCISVVDYAMVQQTSLASTEYPKGVNEFVKAGFTELPSESIQPPRVKESPVQFECLVRQVIELGQEGGAGNLVIAEIKVIHVSEQILDENQRIDTRKIDLVGRMGGDFYTRAQGDSLFEVPKPLQKLGIGFDGIPEKIRNSPVLTGNDLGVLGNVESLPDALSEEQLLQNERLNDVYTRLKNDPDTLSFNLHQYAKELLHRGKVEDAWAVLMLDVKGFD